MVLIRGAALGLVRAWAWDAVANLSACEVRYLTGIGRVLDGAGVGSRPTDDVVDMRFHPVFCHSKTRHQFFL